MKEKQQKKWCRKKTSDSRKRNLHFGKNLTHDGQEGSKVTALFQKIRNIRQKKKEMMVKVKRETTATKKIFHNQNESLLKDVMSPDVKEQEKVRQDQNEDEDEEGTFKCSHSGL